MNIDYEWASELLSEGIKWMIILINNNNFMFKYLYEILLIFSIFDKYTSLCLHLFVQTYWCSCSIIYHPQSIQFFYSSNKSPIQPNPTQQTSTSLHRSVIQYSCPNRFHYQFVDISQLSHRIFTTAQLKKFLLTVW